jgi:hypothetical protein
MLCVYCKIMVGNNLYNFCYSKIFHILLKKMLCVHCKIMVGNNLYNFCYSKMFHIYFKKCCVSTVKLWQEIFV